MRTIGFLAIIVSLSASAQTHSDLNGEWRGQAQYHATVNGSIDTTAHAVTQLTISVASQGKVVGASPENGCSFLGVASPGSFPNILNLDVTFYGCRYTAFNRRFSGWLSYYTKDRYTALSLSAMTIGIGKESRTFDIKATLRR